MVEIQSKEVIDKVSDDLKIQPAMQIPRELAKQIQLVYNVNPKRKGFIIVDSRTTTGAETILSVDNVKDTFITGVWMSYHCDVVADSTSYRVEAQPFENATAINFLEELKITLTATDDFIYVPLNPPVRLARGSLVRAIQTFTVGVSIINGGVTGFTTDPQ